VSARNRFLMLLFVLFLISLGYYFLSTDRTKELVLTGTVDANQVIISSKIMGRIEKLTVEEGQTEGPPAPSRIEFPPRSNCCSGDVFSFQAS